MINNPNDLHISKEEKASLMFQLTKFITDTLDMQSVKKESDSVQNEDHQS
ncbi:MAG: hypothetical protein IJO20_01025 [Ruminococcus sp.]|nr:hypothetical protein [Ruminococcus sp.]